MKIEHVAMYVNDLEKARDFFVKYLNGKSNDLYHNKKTDFSSYVLYLSLLLSGSKVTLACENSLAKHWLN